MRHSISSNEKTYLNCTKPNRSVDYIFVRPVEIFCFEKRDKSFRNFDARTSQRFSLSHSKNEEKSYADERHVGASTSQLSNSISRSEGEGEE